MSVKNITVTKRVWKVSVVTPPQTTAEVIVPRKVTNLTVESPAKIKVVFVGQRGLAGKDGKDFDNSDLITGMQNAYAELNNNIAANNSVIDYSEFIAAYSLSGHRAVKVYNNRLIYASPDDYAGILGITTGAITINQSGTVRGFGLMTENIWNWTPGNSIYLSDDGQLSQTIPQTGVLLEIGQAVSTNKILIDFQAPIILL